MLCSTSTLFADVLRRLFFVDGSTYTHDMNDSLSLPKPWQSLLDEKSLTQLQDARIHLKTRADLGREIYPPESDWFKAFESVAPEDVRVVILGQDPYHGAGQAQGIAFSVPDHLPAPPSLKNILKELDSDLQLGGCVHRRHDLSDWLEQGVLLMNAALTVEAATPGSHLADWEPITDALFDVCTHQPQPIVFILWGSYARKKKGRIYRDNHFVIESAHPSPLSAHRGFFGSKPFSKANAYLKRAGSEPISWPLPDRQFALI